jgi:four helix bundle protein
MFLNLNHKKLDVYNAIRAMIKEAYKVSLLLPHEERFNMIQQLRRAALSVKLNLAEGSTRRTEPERVRYLEIARGSVVEIDAAVETAFDLNYLTLEQLEPLGLLLNKCFAMLSKMMTAKK